MEGSNKVLLQASSEEELVEARKTARKLDLPCVLVADAGRTQIAAGSKTVLALVCDCSSPRGVRGDLGLCHVVGP